MKTRLLLLIIMLPYMGLKAQYLAQKDSTPSDCRWNLADPIFNFVEHTRKAVSYANSEMPVTFSDASYKRDDDHFPCITFNDCSKRPSSLIYDVWYPRHNYIDQKLPAIILFHGGSFEECNTYDQEIMTNLCKEFAKRGFVAFNVEYRRGKVADSRQPNFKSAQEVLAGYRSLQDCRGAIRSIIKRQRLHDSDFPDDPYQIDTTKIFVGGVSAGAFMAITSVWFSNNMIVEALGGKNLDVTVEDALGPVDIDYYFGEPDINIRAAVKGIVSLWGSVPIPYSFLNNQAAFFEQQKTVKLTPVIAFHGALDSVLPFYMNRTQLAYYSPPNDSGPHFNSESTCLINGPFVLPVSGKPDFIGASSLNLYTIAKKLKKSMPFELYVDCQMGHGLDLIDGPTFQSDFGTGLDSAKHVTRYIVARSAIFLQAVMNNASAEDIGPPSIFTECVNTRIKCNKPDDPNRCNDYIICNP